MWPYDTDVPASSLRKHDPNYGIVKDIIAKIVVKTLHKNLKTFGLEKLKLEHGNYKLIIFKLRGITLES